MPQDSTNVSGLVKSLKKVSATVTGKRNDALRLRRLADRARSQRNWNMDVFCRRQICALDPDKASAWTQYGHALKEAGFHIKADEAYRRALELAPDDAGIILHLAHLAKVRGDLNTAAEQFQRAKDLGHPDTAQIEAELRLLRQVNNTSVFWGVSANAPRIPYRIFLSVPGGRISETNRGATAANLGWADYSYSFAMRGFVDALDALEIDYTIIDRPEAIADIRQQSNAEINLHLGFYPPERVRVLKGAYNVNCFAWEFDRLRSKDELTNHHAFADQAAMLEIPDEVWVPSKHGADVVSRAISKPVHYVSAPIMGNKVKAPRSGPPTVYEIEQASRHLSKVNWEPLGILPRIQPSMNGIARERSSPLHSIIGNLDTPTIYLSIFNVHDYRKQIEPMLRSFANFVERDRNAVLLLKVTTPFRQERISNHIITDQISDPSRLVSPMISDRIWLTDAVLTREEMNALFDTASFYLCTSHAEGQNLPLIEAMARAVVPISVDNTAMNDYISQDNAIVAPSHHRTFDIRMAARYRMYGTSTYFIEPDELTDALQVASKMPDETYAQKSSAALKRVDELFGPEHFAARLKMTIDRLSAEKVQ